MGDEQVRKLSELIEGANREMACQAGQLQVIVQALAALVRTHPDPDAFAEAMRRAWMQGETTLGSSEVDAAVTSGIEQVLEVLEGNCSVPLSIRPPGLATPPEH